MANYNNGFGMNYPYGMPYTPYMPQPQQNYNNFNNNNNNMMNNQVQQQPQQQVQTSYLPLTFTSGVVGVKSFIVPPNQTIYLRDSDEGSDLLFQKSADMYGKYTIKAFHLKEVSLDDLGKPVEEKQETISKDLFSSFATKNDLEEFKALFETKMNDLSNLIQKAPKYAKTNVNQKDSDRNEQ